MLPYDTRLTARERAAYFIFDTVFAFCVAVAIGATFALTSCARPVPDLSNAPRFTVQRAAVANSGTRCTAWLPLVVRADFGTDATAEVITAAQPWSDAAGFAIAVPALEGEQATVTVVVEACPGNYRRATAPYCKRLAQTRQFCDGGMYRQRIEVFVLGDEAQTALTLTHELGHALGVDDGCDEWGHSCSPASIMYHSISAPPGLMDGAAGADASTSIDFPQRVLSDDAAALRKAWHL